MKDGTSFIPLYLEPYDSKWILENLNRLCVAAGVGYYELMNSYPYLKDLRSVLESIHRHESDDAA